MENIISFLNTIAGLLIALAGVYVAYANSKKTVEETLSTKIKKQCNIDMEITKKLEDLKEYLCADRVQVYDFHNRRTLC